MRISRGTQSLGPTGRTSRRYWASRPLGRALAAPSCAVAGGVHARARLHGPTDDTPGKGRAPTAARRAGSRGRLAVLPSGNPHPTTRVARSPCPRRLRPIGEIHRCVSESPRCWCPNGHRSLPCPDYVLRERGIEFVSSPAREPPRATPDETPVSYVADRESPTPDRGGQDKSVTVRCGSDRFHPALKPPSR